MYEWLLKLATKRINLQRGEPTKWSPQLIHQMNIINNHISKAVVFWVDSILEEYIIEFYVDTITSQSEAERIFFQGPRGRYLKYLRIWIKILVCEKGILRMEFDK